MLGKNTTNQDAAEAAGSDEKARRGHLSVIGKGMKVTGDCETRGLLRVEGTVCGDVRAAGVEVAKSGSVEGSVSSTDRTADEKPFIIGGRVVGAVSANRVDVRSGGVVRGGIDANEATVIGRVEGGIVARKRLALGSTAVVQGDVRAQRMSMEDGGEVNGTMYMGERASVPAEAPKDSKPELRSLSKKTAAASGAA